MIQANDGEDNNDPNKKPKKSDKKSSGENGSSGNGSGSSGCGGGSGGSGNSASYPLVDDHQAADEYTLISADQSFANQLDEYQLETESTLAESLETDYEAGLDAEHSAYADHNAYDEHSAYDQIQSGGTGGVYKCFHWLSQS